MDWGNYSLSSNGWFDVPTYHASLKFPYSSPHAWISSKGSPGLTTREPGIPHGGLDGNNTPVLTAGHHGQHHVASLGYIVLPASS